MTNLREQLAEAVTKGEASIARGVSPSYCDGVEKFQALAWKHRHEILAALSRPAAGDDGLVERLLSVNRAYQTYANLADRSEAAARITELSRAPAEDINKKEPNND